MRPCTKSKTSVLSLISTFMAGREGWLTVEHLDKDHRQTWQWCFLRFRGQLRPPNVYSALEVCNWLGTVEIKIRERLCPEDKLLFIVINLALLKNVWNFVHRKDTCYETCQCYIRDATSALIALTSDEQLPTLFFCLNSLCWNGWRSM